MMSFLVGFLVIVIGFYVIKFVIQLLFKVLSALLDMTTGCGCFVLGIILFILLVATVVGVVV